VRALTKLPEDAMMVAMVRAASSRVLVVVEFIFFVWIVLFCFWIVTLKEIDFMRKEEHLLRSTINFKQYGFVR